MAHGLKVSGIEIIADRYDIGFIVYFGSYQTEFYNSESDIDIAFLSSRSLTLEEKMQLLDELIKFHSKAEIDLIDLRKAEPVLRYEIALNGKVLYEKENGLFEKYSLYYIKRFYELRPVIEEEMKNISESIKEVLDNA